MTLEDAKKEVLELVKRGDNYRDIAKRKFPVGNKIKKFSIGEISKIKKTSSKEENNSQNIDYDTALLFAEFSKGKNPVDLIIKTKFNPDFVKETYIKFNELRGFRVISKSFIDSLNGLAARLQGKVPNDLEETFSDLKDAVDYYLLPEFTFPCGVCGKPARLDMASWEESKRHLTANKWVHGECYDKANLRKKIF